MGKTTTKIEYNLPITVHYYYDGNGCIEIGKHKLKVQHKAVNNWTNDNLGDEHFVVEILRVTGGDRLTSRIVAEVVKNAARRLGREASSFSGHSLRAGLITTAARRGVPLLKITAQSGHTSLDMLQVYCRDEQLFDGNAAAGLL